MNDTTLLKIIGVEAVKRIQRRIRDNRVKPKTQKAGKGITLIHNGNLANSITSRVEGQKVKIGTNVPYARIHHEGGTIKQKITQKQRSFFWAKYYESDKKDDKWKGAALAKELNIKIPKRPYMFLDEADNEHIVAVAKIYLKKELEK